MIWFYHELYKTILPVLEQLYPCYQHIRELGRFRDFMKLGINLSLLENFSMAAVGTPQECIEQLHAFEASGVTHILCGIGAGAVKTEIAQESLHCIATEVMPAFRQE